MMARRRILFNIETDQPIYIWTYDQENMYNHFNKQIQRLNHKKADQLQQIYVIGIDDMIPDTDNTETRFAK